MPAEWERQEATWLSWPHNPDSFYEYIQDVEQAYVTFIRALSTGQHVHVLVNDRLMHDRAAGLLKRGRVAMVNVELHEIPTVDVWFRDYGPTFVINPAANQPLAMVKWTFNAWGWKYEDLAMDDRIPRDMNEFMQLPMFEPGIILEGGSIDVNGAGCVLTTEQCLLNPNRNPGLFRQEIETKLRENLAVEKVLWLGEGIAGDDTDGHVDDIARFVNPTTIACAWADDEQDENYTALAENFERLKAMTDANGDPFTIVKLPMPARIECDGKPLPASYLNFYIGNDVVVVPMFEHANDSVALATTQSLFPSRKVVGVDCRRLVLGLGTLHCASQQQPMP